MAALSALSIPFSEDVNQKDLIPLQNSNCSMNRSLIPHGSEAWHVARIRTACASEMAALLGIDTNKSRAACLKEKLERKPELSPTAERMCDVGKAYEPVALYQAQSFFPYSLIDLGSLRYNHDMAFEGRPDAVTMDPWTFNWVPIEVKTRAYPNPFDSVPYETVFDVPLKHWIQLQCYMILLNSPSGYLISFSPNHGLRMFQQMFSPELANNHILPCVKQFRENSLSSRVKSSEKKDLLALLDMLVKEQTEEVVFYQALKISVIENK